MVFRPTLIVIQPRQLLRLHRFSLKTYNYFFIWWQIKQKEDSIKSSGTRCTKGIIGSHVKTEHGDGLKKNVLASLTFAKCVIGAQANKTWLKCGAVLASTSQITGSFKVEFCLEIVIDGPIFSFLALSYAPWCPGGNICLSDGGMLRDRNGTANFLPA